MVVTGEEDTDRDPDGVDRDVHRRAEATGDEMLVGLIADRVGDSERERGPLTAEGAYEQEAEHGELGGVSDLAQDEVPAAEPGAEIRDRGQDEDQGRPGHDRTPPPRHPHGRSY